MNEQDKATTIIPESPSENLIRRVDSRDKLVRVIEVCVLLAFGAFSTFTNIRLQHVIDQNQRDVLVARQANIDRQQEQQGYIKCIVLLKFSNPPLDPNSQKSVEQALDNCAKQVDKQPNN